MNAVKNALIEHEPTQAPIVQTDGTSDSAAIFQIIARLASNPNADPDKIERFLAMREKELDRIASQAFNRAMRAAQEEMRPISADAENTQTRSKYATYAKLDRALRPIYTRHGFALSFDEGDSPKPDHIRCLAYVTHDDGHMRTYHKDMPADGKGAKGGDVMTKTHATGAAASYGQRYLLKGIFNVAVGEDDTDGNTAAEDENLISKDQAATIRKLIEETGTDIERFCKWARIEAVPMLLARHYDKAVNVLQQRKAKS